MNYNYHDFDALRFKWSGRRMNEGFWRFHITDNYKEELRQLDDCPYKELYISGITQKNLEYFVGNYGNRFPVLAFVQCNCLKDFSCLSQLSEVEYLIIEWNTKATRLWDMSGNTSLKGLCLEETKKILSFEEISNAPLLEEFVLDEGVNSLTGSNKWKPTTLRGIEKAQHLKRLKVCIGGVSDGDISPLLELKGLERLHLITNLFELKEFALINATLKRTIVNPNKPFYTFDNDAYALVVGKGRSLKKDSPKLIDLQRQWDDIVKP